MGAFLYFTSERKGWLGRFTFSVSICSIGCRMVCNKLAALMPPSLLGNLVKAMSHSSLALFISY